MASREPAGGCYLDKVRLVFRILSDDTKDLARAFRKMAEALLEMGKVDEAAKALTRADEILSGTPSKVSGRIVQMPTLTPDQLEGRRRAIALSSPPTPLHQAAAEHKDYGSLNRWADAHGFPRSSLHAAAVGPGYARPEWDTQARKDFPQVFAGPGKKWPDWTLPAWDWPVGVKARRSYRQRQ